MRLLFAIWIALIGSHAAACTAEADPDWFDRQISVSDNGSFQYAEGDSLSNTHGGSIHDLKNGNIAQRITYGSVCGHSEYLVFADCRSREVAAVLGTNTPDNTSRDYGLPLFAVNIQAPLGALNVHEIESVSEFVSIAYANDYHINLRIEFWVDQMDPQNRFDPFHGCKMFYPESYGARS